MRDDLVAAFALLTRLPVARFGRNAPDLARSVWAFPLVGLVIGALGGLAFWLGHDLGLPPFLGACWAVVAMLAATGAFHEDGLADTADGFGGGRTRERKMEIMRDSRIGSYGALALMLSLLMRVGAVAALERPRLVVIALIIAAMLARAGIILTLILLRPVRQDGMAGSMGDIPHLSAALGLALAAVAPFLLLPLHGAVIVVLVALGACLALAKLAHIQIGGHTGDVLGAGAVIGECVALTAIVSVLS
ncbi:MAG: hypothetical protein JWM91_1827 [Rhodospirillales bacterium]|nr:hypothetical protein [Rhodospirillales bacterium]